MYRIDHTKSLLANMTGLANDKYFSTSGRNFAVGDFLLGTPVAVTPEAGNGNSNTSLQLTGVTSRGYVGQTTIFYDRFTLADNRPSIGNKFLAPAGTNHVAAHNVILEKLRLLSSEVSFIDPPYAAYGGAEIPYTVVPKTDSHVYLPGNFQAYVKIKGNPSLPPVASNTWLNLTPPAGSTQPVARAGAASWSHGGKIYIHGGGNASSTFNDLWCYDPKKNTWTQLSNGGPAFIYHCAVVHNGIAYLFGGSTAGGNTPSALFYKYEMATDTWTQLANGPGAVYQRAGVLIGDSIYYYGGHNGSTASSAANVYNVIAGTWTTYGTDVTLHGHAMAQVGGTIYRYHGRVWTTVWSVTKRIDRVTPPGAWSTMVVTAAPGVGRFGSAVVAYNSKVYLFGGATDTAYATLADFYSHDPVANTYVTLATGPTKRALHSLLEADGRLYVFGGRDASTYNNELWAYQP